MAVGSATATSTSGDRSRATTLEVDSSSEGVRMMQRGGASSFGDAVGSRSLGKAAKASKNKSPKIDEDFEGHDLL